MRSPSHLLDSLAHTVFGFPVRRSYAEALPRDAKIAAVLYFLLPEAGIAQLFLLDSLGTQLALTAFFGTLTAYALVRVIIYRLRLTINPPSGVSGRLYNVLILCAFSFADIAFLWQTTTGYVVALAITAVVAFLGFRITRTHLTKSILDAA